MTDTRAPRPTDLVALVTFDEEVRENQAVTRDHLGVPNEPPRPLAAAIEQWLHLGRRTWINVSGREIRGIATARDLTSRSAWEIDTLLDAPEAGEQVIVDLLRQAARAAREATATHLLLRTPVDSPASQEAPRAGFRPVVQERLWIGSVDPLRASESSVHVREATEADTYARFQVYSRALPVAAREALAMTVEEWTAVQDYRWVDRGGVTLVAERDSRVVASARCARSGQFTLAAEDGAVEAGAALLSAMAHLHGGPATERFALAPQGSVAEDVLRRGGMTPAAEYALFCLRLRHPVREEVHARAGVPITG
ncbi:MAG: hypothetical protein M0R73_09025 [Dehalococcoidia bacterium]|nr:hypothetical protein [Dehalococcoidia bacterium]